MMVVVPAEPRANICRLPMEAIRESGNMVGLVARSFLPLDEIPAGRHVAKSLRPTLIVGSAKK